MAQNKYQIEVSAKIDQSLNTALEKIKEIKGGVNLDDKSNEAVKTQIKQIEAEINNLKGKVAKDENGLPLIDLGNLDLALKQVNELAKQFDALGKKLIKSGETGVAAEVQAKDQEVKNKQSQIQKEQIKLPQMFNAESKKATNELLVKATGSVKDAEELKQNIQNFANISVNTLKSLQAAKDRVTELVNEFGLKTPKDLSKANEQLNKIETEDIVDKAGEIKNSEEYVQLKTQIDQLRKELQVLKQERDTVASTSPDNAAFAASAQGRDVLTQVGIGAKQAQQELKESIVQTTQVQQNQNKVTEKSQGTFAKAAKQVFSYGTAITLLKRIYRETIKAVTEMDKALTSMSVVTGMSREQTHKLVGAFQELAKETGQTTSAIAGIATKYYQQGKSTEEVLKLTEAAAKAASIAGIDASRSVDLLTTALNGFRLEADQAMEVSDKFAALAASSASNYEELAVALSKVASQANLAGMSIDFTLGLLAKGVETTRRKIAA